MNCSADMVAHFFPPLVKLILLPNLDILGVPIGDFAHCSQLIAEECMLVKALLKALVDLHMAMSLLRTCGGFCKLVNLARSIPPSHCSDSLMM